MSINVPLPIAHQFAAAWTGWYAREWLACLQVTEERHGKALIEQLGATLRHLQNLRVRDLPTLEWFKFMHAVEVNNATLWFYQSKPAGLSSRTERIKTYRLANANNDVSMYQGDGTQTRRRKLFVNATADEIEQGTQVIEAMQEMKQFGRFITQIVVDTADGLFAAFDSTEIMKIDDSDAQLRMQQRVRLSPSSCKS